MGITDLLDKKDAFLVEEEFFVQICVNSSGGRNDLGKGGINNEGIYSCRRVKDKTLSINTCYFKTVVA